MDKKKPKQKSILIFEQKEIRRLWNDEKELWYFSVVDVIESIVQTDRPRKYWNDLKIKLKSEGNQLSEKIGQLKMLASDGKKYDTDIADTETVLRLIQSIPSPKAEPFKLWLAKVGYERIEEIEDPEKAFDRAMGTYLQKGYSKEWINQRLKTTEISKSKKPKGLQENKKVALEGGSIAGNARKDIEKVTKQEVISKERFINNKNKLK